MLFEWNQAWKNKLDNFLHLKNNKLINKKVSFELATKQLKSRNLPKVL